MKLFKKTVLLATVTMLCCALSSVAQPAKRVASQQASGTEFQEEKCSGIDESAVDIKDITVPAQVKRQNSPTVMNESAKPVTKEGKEVKKGSKISRRVIVPKGNTKDPRVTTDSLKKDRSATVSKGKSQAPRLRAGTPVSLPSGVSAETWKISTVFYIRNYTSSDYEDVRTTYTQPVKVAIDGTTCYVAGLCNELPNAWVQGTFDGSTMSIPTGQYCGTVGTNEYYLVGDKKNSSGGYEPCAIVFTYNEIAGTLTLGSGIYINSADTNVYDDMLLYSYLTKTVLTSSDKVNVFDATSDNRCIPVYGSYFDYGTATQMIYPADSLDIERGSIIKSITFYSASTLDANLSYSNINVSLGEVNTTTAASSVSAMNSYRSGLTLCAENAKITSGSDTWTITFDTPYTYNGGNLMIDNVVSGNSSHYWKNTPWYGSSKQPVASAAIVYKSSEDGSYTFLTDSTRTFLPKITFEIEKPATITIDKTELSFGNVNVGSTSAAQTVTVSNSTSDAVSLSWTFSNSKFATTATATSVASGGNVEIPVTFAPGSDTGAMSGTLTITAGSQQFTVTLSGTGVESQSGSDQVTVCDGTTTSYYAPVYGTYFDYGTATQMIYPASLLEGLSGKSIKSITFYSTEELDANLTHSDVTVSLGEVNATTTSSDDMASNLNSATNQTTAARITSGINTWTITLDEPYQYQGGNLLIDNEATAGGTYKKTAWYGTTRPENSFVYCYKATSTATQYTLGTESTAFLPKVTFEVEASTPDGETTEIDFGNVNANTSSTRTATIVNESEQTVTATLTTATPFLVTSSSMSMAPGTNSVSVTFTPTEARNYNGTLTITMGDVVKTVKLKGVGVIEGSPAALRDSAFFAGIEYTWQENGTGTSHTSKLTEIATDPDQIIAMLSEVYTNKSIPGTFKRGYSSSGGSDHDDDVQYTGVGSLIDSNNYIIYNDAYGWNIPGNIQSATSGNYQYFYMDPEQYKPYSNGTTLLLLELVDNFNYSEAIATQTAATSDYAQLREYFRQAIKSARIITESKRTGEGFNAGSLFKINCDKMNKFYLIAKGQLLWFTASRRAVNSDFYNNPCYIYRDGEYDGYVDRGLSFDYLECCAFLGHMFEQFSPAVGNATETRDDIYQDLVNMESFGVVHDCPNVPYVGHHFMMYGEDSEAADCQDVRDMMFFIPDYRMMNHDYRGGSGSIPNSSDRGQDYFNYNPIHPPTMGLYVIRQDEITGEAANDDYYRLTLTWDSNMDEFMPSDEQEYQLLQLVQDEFGNDTYIPVYYTNANGYYTDANGNVLTDPNPVPVPITLTFSSSSDKKTYTNVYVQQQSGSQQVTYAIQGQDTGHFLSLQISNQESYTIPGKDPAEMILLSDATHYSRFNPQTEKNCYSNKMTIANNPNGIKSSYLAYGTTLTVKRMTSLTDTEPVTVATATVTSTSSQRLNVQLSNQAAKSEFPAGQGTPNSSYRAGYHANTGGEGDCSWNLTYTVSNGYVNFGDFVIYDNFVADVSANEHPSQYIYKVELTQPSSSTVEAYSNTFRVPVYKTDSRINGVFAKAKVDADGVLVNGVQTRMELPDNVQFDEQVRRSSKTEILRYDVYRWNSEDSTTFFIVDTVKVNDYEVDIAPHGIAGNQGESYTVTMNDIEGEYYYNSSVGVSQTSPENWAEFVDYYPNNVAASAYTYAPVVELFTKGVDVTGTAHRTDYNTYGGPLQKTAVGKVTVEASEDMVGSQNYSWTKDNVTYCYYNVPLKFSVLDVPEEYEVYKVRAWRLMHLDDLDEPAADPNHKIPDRSYRLSSDYLFEDLTYGDDIDYAVGMNKDILKDASYQIGARAVQADSVQRGETMATFGAKKLAEGETMDANFIVRVYFTKVNTDAATTLNGGPRRALTPENLSADGKYYVAEGTCTVTLNSSIITGVDKLAESHEVQSVHYVNTIGQVSDKPWNGVNIVVTRYTDGTQSTAKVVK